MPLSKCERLIVFCVSKLKICSLCISLPSTLCTITERIKQLRAEKRLSQTELAHMCGKDSQSLERVENGKTNPSVYYLLEIAKALKISLKDLFSKGFEDL